MSPAQGGLASYHRLKAFLTSPCPSLPPYSLLLARLLVLPMVALQLTVAHGQPSNCYAVYKTMLTIYGIIVANGTAVFVVRTLVSASYAHLHRERRY